MQNKIISSTPNLVEILFENNSEIQKEFIELYNLFHPLDKVKLNQNQIVLPTSSFLNLITKFEKIDEFQIDNNLEKLINNYEKNIYFIKNQIDFSNPSIQDKKELKTALSDIGFQRDLFDHQLENLYKLINLPSGAIFSVPGAGKTSVILALIALLEKKLSIIFVPNTGVMTSWIDDFKSCFGEKIDYELIEITKEDSVSLKKTLDRINKPSLLLITYDKISRNTNNFNVIRDYLSIKSDSHIILDESHRIKSGIVSGYKEPSLRGKLIIDLAKFSERRDILSGTPMTQDVYDLVSQFSFLYPMCGLNKKILQNEENPNNAIENLYTRTVKSQLPLPESIDHPIISVDMSKAQAAFYKILVNRYSKIYRKLPPANDFKKASKAITRMIELSVDPYNVAKKLLDKADEDMSQFKSDNRAYKNSLLKLLEEGEVSNKMKKAITLANEIVNGGEKVIIWCYFVNSIEVLEKEFRNRYGIEALTLYGSSKYSQKYIIDKFNHDENYKILIANLESGGEGISLHKMCRKAIYLSRTYKAGQYLQSRDRIHRVGMSLDFPVEYYFLESVYPEEHIFPSIDRKISENLQGKLINISRAINDVEVKIIADYEESYRDDSTYSSSDLNEWVEWLPNNE